MFATSSNLTQKAFQSSLSINFAKLVFLTLWSSLSSSAHLVHLVFGMLSHLLRKDQLPTHPNSALIAVLSVASLPFPPGAALSSLFN
jgi:hypothetical protein